MKPILAALFLLSPLAHAEPSITLEKNLSLASATDVLVSQTSSDTGFSRQSCMNPLTFRNGRSYQWLLNGSGNGCGAEQVVDTESGAKLAPVDSAESCDISLGNLPAYPAVIGQGTKFRIDTEKTYRTSGTNLQGKHYAFVVWFIEVPNAGFITEAFRCTYNPAKGLNPQRILELTGGRISITQEAL